MKFPSFLKAVSATAAMLLVIPAIAAESAAELIKQGDACDVKFQAQEALTYYIPAEKLQPENIRLLVRISRQYRHMMTDAATQNEKLRLGGIALAYAQRSAALAPNDAEAQLAVAITYGKMLPFQGTKEQVATSPLIKDAVDKAIKLDPGNDTAWHILGRWNRGLADVSPIKRGMAEFFYGKLPNGTNEEAVTCFQKAIEINPNRLMHYIELGITYSQMTGRQDDARRFITKGLAMPDEEKDDPETKQRGRDALEKLH